LASEAFTNAERIGDPLLRLISQMNLAKALRRTEPKRAEKILRDAARGSGASHGLGYAELYNELSELLSELGLAEEALKYSRKAYEVERKN
jgi:tetratricopeptide (TPR) repeat protein